MTFHKKNIQIEAVYVISRGPQTDIVLQNPLQKFHKHGKQTFYSKLVYV